jgi:multiple sugar transport system substrate-binding protein
MKTKKKYIISLGLICILILGILFGYHMLQPETITLEFGMFAGSNWDVADANSYAIIDKAIEKFEKEHKNVKIHYYSGILKEDYSEWFSRQMLTGKMPDVFMILTNDFDKFSSMGVIKNLDLLMANDNDFNSSDYYATTLNTGKYLGAQYALPYQTVPELMFVNKTLLKKDGIDIPNNNWTWNDMYRICSNVTKDSNKDGILDQFGMYGYSWMEAAYSNGANFFNSSGTEANFTDEKVLDSIKFTKQLYDLNRGTKTTLKDFDSGNVAFRPFLFSDYRTYKTYPYKLKKYNQFQWDCITLPAGPNGGNTSIINTLLMGISNETSHEELAWEFLKTLTYDQEIQMDIFRYSQGVSVQKKVTKSEEAEKILQNDMESSEKSINNNLLDSIIDKGMIEPKFNKYNEAMTLADNQIQKVIEEDEDTDSAMKIFQRNISSYLKR